MIFHFLSHLPLSCALIHPDSRCRRLFQTALNEMQQIHIVSENVVEVRAVVNGWILHTAGVISIVTIASD